MQSTLSYDQKKKQIQALFLKYKDRLTPSQKQRMERLLRYDNEQIIDVWYTSLTTGLPAIIASASLHARENIREQERAVEQQDNKDIDDLLLSIEEC